MIVSLIAIIATNTASIAIFINCSLHNREDLTAIDKLLTFLLEKVNNEMKNIIHINFLLGLLSLIIRKRSAIEK